MGMTTNDRLTQAFTEYLSGNKGPEGQPAEYGISAEGDPATGALQLTLVFKRGVPCCCIESTCHLGIRRPGGWEALRRVLASAGITIEPKIELRLKVIVEQGALIFVLRAFKSPPEASAKEYEEILRESEEKVYWTRPEPPLDYTGIWTTYGPDEQKERETTYVNGRIQGRVTVYCGNGRRIREFHILDGQRHGTETQWSADGEVLNASEWEHGTGTYRIFYSSGQLSSEQQMRHGKPHGIARYWNGKGELACTEYYEDGKRIRREGNPVWRHLCALQVAPTGVKPDTQVATSDDK
jgi:antitoxin component YwqK of YwqJK toxin-antitoxin module